MKRGILGFLKSIWIFSFLRRLAIASSYYNKRYLQILKWGFTSNEYTNFTFEITEENKVTMAQTVAAITNKKYDEILAYIKEAESNTELHQHILSVTESSDQRRYADKAVRFGRRLGWYAFVRAMKPKLVVETGVDKGLGSVLLCSAIEKNRAEGFEGSYLGTDINPKAGYLLTGKYQQFGKILYGDSIESLKKLDQKIDLFVNDSDHSDEYEYQEYITIKSKLSEHAVILGDNSHCTNKLSQFSLENNRHFIFFQEIPKNHWYPGSGIGISFVKN